MKSEKEIYKRFEKIKMIGEGAHSKVYSVREKTTGKIFALKKLNDSNFEETTREINILKQINHPNIIKIFEDQSQSGKRYIILEKADCKNN